jgi:hypothetical protein
MKVRFPRLLLIASGAIVCAGMLSSIAQQGRAQGKTAADSASVASAERKLEHLESNGARTNPDSSPTTFTEQEINAYVAAGNVKLPAGVQSATFQEQPQVVIATSRVDFDQIKSGKNSYNPLLSVFSGVHDVVATAHAYGAHGQGFVHIDSVSLDGVEIPQFALQLFAEKYLKPKYPNLGIDSQFALPDRINSVSVGSHDVTLNQK